MHNKALVLDLVEWISPRPRPYTEVMTAWRTSCPRLTIWEDAVDLGFLIRAFRPGEGSVVEITGCGRDFLQTEGRGPTSPGSRAPAA